MCALLRHSTTQKARKDNKRRKALQEKAAEAQKRKEELVRRVSLAHPLNPNYREHPNLPVSFVLRFSSVEGTGCGFGSCQARDQQGGRWRPRCAHRRHEEWPGVCQPSAPRPWWRSADGRPRRPDAGGSSGWRGPDDVRKPEEDGTQISHSFVAVCAVLVVGATSTTCDTLSVLFVSLLVLLA